MKNFVEELKWRGMLAQMMPGTEELLQKEMGNGLSGYRPYSRFTPYRSPLWHHDAAPLAALWPQAHHPRGWCYGYDWRPFW